MSIPPVGFLWGITEDSNCYRTTGPVPPNGLPLNTTTVDEVWGDEGEECGCCDTGLYPFIYKYSLCTEYDPAPGGAPGFVDIDVTGYPNYLSGAHPDVISVDVGIGFDVCYEYLQPECIAPTHVMVSAFEDCATCIAGESPVWELLSCDGAYTEYVSQSELAPDPSALNVGEVINTTAGTLSAIASCWEIIDKNSPNPVTQTGTQDWNGPIVAGFYTECECCNYDLRIYDVCDVGSPCTGTVASQLIIDMSAFGGAPPNDIIATDIASGNDCCYYLSESLPECVEITGTYVSTTAGCEDPTCNSL
jgi:hypothetical protein